MKAISIRQPWAHLVVAGVKTIENRFWTTSYRGGLFIHASLNIAREAQRELRRLDVRVPDVLARGAIIGFAELVDVVEQSDDRFFTGPFGFVLRNAQPLKRPIPLVGRSRLFDVGSISL